MLREFALHSSKSGTTLEPIVVTLAFSVSSLFFFFFFRLLSVPRRPDVKAG